MTDATRLCFSSFGLRDSSSRYRTTRCIEIAKDTTRRTATKFAEMTVIRQSRKPSRPSIIVTVIKQFVTGITTHLTSRKIIASIIIISKIIAVPKTNRSLSTKATISAAIMGTPPTKIFALESNSAAIALTLSTNTPC